MKIERFAANDMSHAIRLVKAEMGAEAVILSNMRRGDQVEVLAAADYDERLLGEIAPPMLNDQVGPPSRGMKPLDISTLELKEELESLQKVFKAELAGLRADKKKATADEGFSSRLKFQERLRDLGFSSVIVEHLSKKIPAGINKAPNWLETLKRIGGLLHTGSNEIIEHGGIHAMVGSTGVGKTTTVAKLAAQFAFRHGSNEVALVTTDTMRIGGLEQLTTFARTLGVPLSVAANASELTRAVNEYRHKKLVLIDTAGMSQRDIELTGQIGHYKQGVPGLQVCLVLSSIVQSGITQEIIHAFRGVPIASAIITKTDETLQLGPVLSGIILARLPVSYVCNGQSVPEDIEPATREMLCRLIYKLMKEHARLPGMSEARELKLHV